MEEQLRCLEKRYDHNQTRPPEQERRQKLLREMFAEIGGGCYIEPPPHADRGGHHVHFGSNVYANLGLTPEDDTHIFIGGDTAAARAASSRTICRAVWRTSGAVPRGAPDRRRRQDLLFPRPADTGGGADCRRRERRGTVSKTQRTVGLTHGPLSFFRYPANWLLYSLA